MRPMNPCSQLRSPEFPRRTSWFRLQWWAGFGLCLAGLAGLSASAQAQSFALGPIASNVSNISTSTVQAFANYSVSIALSSNTSPQSWSVNSTASWITFAANTGVTPATLQVTLNASLLPTGVNQANISLTTTQGNFTIPVFLQADPLTLTMIRSDPTSTKVYAISEAPVTTGTSRAYLLEIDSLLQTITRVAPAGTGVTDFTIHQGDNRIYVANWQIGALLAINLTTFALDQTYTNSSVDIYHVSAGVPGRLVVEGENQFVDVSIFNTTSGSVLASTTQYEGGGAFEPTGRYYYHGISGISTPGISKFDTTGDKFSQVASSTIEGAYYYGDPVVVIPEDGSRVFWNGGVFDQNLTVQWLIGDIIYCASADGHYAFSNTTIYDVDQKQAIGSMPVDTMVSAYNSATSRLVLQNGQSLGFYNLVGPGLLGAQMSPQPQAVTLPPSQLQWSAMPGVTSFEVYLGTSASAVANATTTSPQFLGNVTSPAIALTSPLAPGQTYYWRVDMVTPNRVATGAVESFSVSNVNSSLGSVNATTTQGNANYPVSIGLSATVPGLSWAASSNASWVTFAANTGVTPATLQVTLNASQLPPGLNQTNISITTSQGNLTIPVNLQVDPLALTMIRSDPSSTKVYAISEAPVTTGASRAYLLEIDSLLQTVTRVVPVGTGVTDFTIHHGDNRIYVTNWLIGNLLAVNLTTFSLDQTYDVPPFTEPGYSAADVYHVSAGAPGRLVVESAEEQVDISIFNTTSGSDLATITQGQGGGAFDPAGRYYYHGEDGTSLPYIRKFDTAGDTFADVAGITVSGASSYGDATVIVSEDGSRVFWNGVVFDPNLTAQWIIGDVIYCVSADGRYAFSNTTIYDVNQKQAIGSMPVDTKISAYNSATGRLVVQNGQNLAFCNLVGPGPLGAQMSPQNQVVTLPPSQLQWSAMPGVTSYEVYLGTSAGAVANATTSSSQFLGNVTTSSFALSSALAPGQTYYWRVDMVAPGGVATGSVESFVVSTVVPSASSVSATTTQGNPGYPVAIGLSSVAPGTNWAANSDASWIEFAANTGVTPATLQITLNASQLTSGLNQANLSITTSQGVFTIPVSLQVDPLALTVMRSDPGSPKVYAVSEAHVATGSSRAYLIEIDSQLQAVTRVVPVGTGATDFAIHHGDNRIYVTNWQIGSLLAINLTTFALDQTYAVPPFKGAGYSSADVYHVSAGAPGRLVFEGENQFVDMTIFNTATGSDLISSLQTAGDGGFDPTGRYYYHGDSGVSNDAIHKFDTTGDKFSQVASYTIPYGNGTVVVSADGSRIFWNGGVFDSNLDELWAIKDIIYCASADGQFAFGQSKIYDTTTQQAVLAMPLATTVSAYNSLSGTLVLQNGQSLGFYPLNNGPLLPIPVLSAGAVGSTSANLAWVENGPQSGFTLQLRRTFTTVWTNVTTTLAANATAYTVTGLQPNSSYDFMLLATSPVVVSAPSNIVTVRTSAPPPAPPAITTQPGNQTVTVAGNATFTAAAGGAPVPALQWQVSTDAGVTWSNLTDGSNVTGSATANLTLSNVTAAMSGKEFQLLAMNSAGSATSTVATLTVNIPPNITIQPASQTMSAGQHVTFSVAAVGILPQTYQWFLNGHLIPGATQKTLTLSNLQASNAGAYTVVITNRVGKATSGVALLSVAKSRPRITLQPVSISIPRGQTLSLKVAAMGTAPLTYAWQKFYPYSYVFVINRGNISGVHNSILTITAASLANAGVYRVVVSNSVGQTTSAVARLTVK
jgi:Immunoglobulin domain/Immunoglobulin I-set domain/Fibronectin type III domain